jgi:DNA polymerase II
MKGFIVNLDYAIESGKPVITLWGRLESCKSFCAKVHFTPYFHIKESDLKKALEILKFEHDGEDMKDFAGDAMVKVIAKRPQDVPDMRRMLEDGGVLTCESDIRFVQRWLIDNDIKGAIEIEGKHTKGAADYIFEDPVIRPAEPYDAALCTLVIDIETDIEAKRIYSISLVTDDCCEVHISTNAKTEKAITHKDEKKMLEEFIKRVNELDPDIITGWNLVDFDLKVLAERMRHHRIPFNIGRGGSECIVRLSREFMRSSSATVPGRVVLDGISMMRQAFISSMDYKLGTVAESVLGDRKVELPTGFFDDLPSIAESEPDRLAEYNLKDSQLVLAILKKLKLVEFLVQKSQITGMQLDRVKGSVASLDSLYLRKAKERGIVCPNSKHSEREEQIKGAFVMEPKQGVYDNIVVFDFKSLYPSIMITFNIDPVAFARGGPIVAPNGARFADDSGILPEIITELWKERDKAKKEKDAVKTYAVKIIMNSFYGVLANPTCRFYSLEMGNAITAFAREIIQETAKLIEKEGYTVLYGDTDSVFVDFKAKSLKEAEELGKELSAKVNRHFKDHIKKKWGRESKLELQSDKLFKALLLPKMRGKEEGAKKRYAGLLVSDGKEEVKATGMELVRRDWTDLAKEFQRHLLDLVFHKKDVESYIRKTIEDLKAGKVDDKLIYRKGLTKDLSEYTKTTPPHVKAARMLPKITNNVIEYYMTVDGPQPVSIRKSVLDYDHYIEKQIKPLAQTILEQFGQSFDDFVKGAKQKSLGDY